MIIDPNAKTKAMKLLLSRMFMPPKPQWNAMVPRLPAWFRIAIRKVDPNLTLQFFPPASEAIPDGVNPEVYPDGVWAVVRRLPKTGWLHRRWTYGLYGMDGRQAQPTLKILQMIRVALKLWLRDAGDRMEASYDEACQAVLRGNGREKRDQLLCRIADDMRALGMRSSLKPRMVVPA